MAHVEIPVQPAAHNPSVVAFSQKGFPPEEVKDIWILMKHLNFDQLLLSLENPKQNPSTNGPSREEGAWPEMEDWPMSSFIREPLPQCGSSRAHGQHPPHTQLRHRGLPQD